MTVITPRPGTEGTVSVGIGDRDSVWIGVRFGTRPRSRPAAGSASANRARYHNLTTLWLRPSVVRNRARYHNLTTLWLRPSGVRVGACLRAASSFSAAAWNALSCLSRTAPLVTRRLTVPGFLRSSCASCPTFCP